MEGEVARLGELLEAMSEDSSGIKDTTLFMVAAIGHSIALVTAVSCQRRLGNEGTCCWT
jgi:hypothetical protein